MRILLIEDDPVLSLSIAKHLKGHTFAVDLAADGLKGEELAKVNSYDVIVLDVMLPGQDGWHTCVNLRKAKVLSPILMLTALGEVEDRIRGLESGADDYLVKPFHVGELVARIRSLARRATTVRSSTLEQFGLRLDLNLRRASREGHDISLTAKEFALLELLMMHPNRILSREEISEHLWDMNFDPRSNVIESFVKFLRRKIDRGFSRSLIHTVRGAGYLFSDTEP
jgi:DNA-binding response OmpR family regulator